jgi:hypothetical protein
VDRQGKKREFPEDQTSEASMEEVAWLLDFE